jgi:hypothetical protein
MRTRDRLFDKLGGTRRRLAKVAVVAVGLGMFAGAGLSGALAQDDEAVVVGGGEAAVSAEALAESILAEIFAQLELPTAGTGAVEADMPTGGTGVFDIDTPTGGSGVFEIDVPTGGGDINVGGGMGGTIEVGGSSGGDISLGGGSDVSGGGGGSGSNSGTGSIPGY